MTEEGGGWATQAGRQRCWTTCVHRVTAGERGGCIASNHAGDWRHVGHRANDGPTRMVSAVASSRRGRCENNRSHVRTGHTIDRHPGVPR